MRQAAAGSDPNAAIRIGEKRFRVGVFGDQAIGPAVVMPFAVIEAIDARIRSNPHAAPELAPQNEALVKTQAGGTAKVRWQKPFAIHGETCDSYRLRIGNPHSA